MTSILPGISAGPVSACRWLHMSSGMGMAMLVPSLATLGRV